MKRLSVSAIPLIAYFLATPAMAAAPAFSYVPNSMVQSTIIDGPWTLHEQTSFFQHDASGIIPTTSAPPYVGDGYPYADYCDKHGVVTKNHGPSVMKPFYFPFVRARLGVLEGYFDYRPRNEQESTVAAISNDWGATWHFKGEALALNPYCPWDASDPDNQNINVNGVQTSYDPLTGPVPGAADNGLGHATVLSVNGVQRIYHLDRANNHIDSDQLVVHPLPNLEALKQLPAYGFVSPLISGGYPTLESTATATTGLQNPDAMIGSTVIRGTTTIVYVEKTLNGDASFPKSQICPSTPAFALTNLDHQGKVKKANHDVVTVRVATTTDGINFTDVGATSGLYDQTTIAFNGLRWLGSGSLIPLSDGRFGMFFGAGNCLDNDSDGFHFMGYAETMNTVSSPSDLLSWRVINGPDNPILSTDTVVDPTGPRAYPLNAPVVNLSRADVLTAAQVAPWTPPTPGAPIVTPPGGYNSNFYSGRVYDPQVLYTDDHTLTIVFAGYNAPQPSSNLADYRTIGRFQLKVPAGYFAPN